MQYIDWLVWVTAFTVRDCKTACCRMWTFCVVDLPTRETERKRYGAIGLLAGFGHRSF
jgi:hypothetical protein